MEKEKDNLKFPNIAKDVLGEIKEKNIKPKPKWGFLLKDSFVWLAGFLSLFIGSISFAVIIYAVRSSDWEVYKYVNKSLFNFIIFIFPYFWVILLAIFVFVADYIFKNTKEGYKYKFHIVVTASVILSMFLGAILYAVGVGQKIDDKLAEKVPMYGRMVAKMPHRMDMLNQPEDGLLSGIVIIPGNASFFVLRDFERNDWNVNTENIDLHCEIREGMGVKVIGEIIKQDGEYIRIFEAEDVFPLLGQKWMRYNPRTQKGIILIDERK